MKTHLRYKKITVKVGSNVLTKSDGTLNDMIKDGRLKNNTHYTKHINGKKVMISFVEDGILAYKKGLK